jgi:glutaredoxin
MKKMLGALAGAMFIGNAVAADLTIYHMPTCPHCHHAREFASQKLVYEYPELKVTTIDVTQEANRQDFMDTLKKCKYESGGVPVMVIGEKCFQGYADSMADDVRAAIEVDMDDAAKATAAENKKSMETEEGAKAFREAHSDRASAMVEREIKETAQEEKKEETKTEESKAEEVKSEDKPAEQKAEEKTAENTAATKSNDSWVFYVILIVLVAGLGFVLTRKGKK